eukprot:COSAG05_NODE_1263_length_5338_cov_44.046956_7_plen_72_part_00
MTHMTMLSLTVAELMSLVWTSIDDQAQLTDLGTKGTMLLRLGSAEKCLHQTAAIWYTTRPPPKSHVLVHVN